MIALHVETVLLQCAAGALMLLWPTRRHSELSPGYAWVVRGVAGLSAAGSAFFALRYGRNGAVAALAIVVAVFTAAANGASWYRSRSLDGAAERPGDGPRPLSAKLWRLVQVREYAAQLQRSTERIPVAVDVLAAMIGMVGVVSGGIVATRVGDAVQGGPIWLSVLRAVAGALFLGAVIDLIVLAHWYLAQAGLPRSTLVGMVDVVGWTGAPLVVALLLSPGMVSVFTGAIDDGYNGMLGWFWAACAATTLGLVFVVRAVLRERDDAAIMAAIGLTHILLLTSLGTDLVARAILSAA